MNSNTLVMMSPHHADTDYRVLRTLAEASKVFDKVELVWDVDYQGHQYTKHAKTDNISTHYTKLAENSLRKLFMRKVIFNDTICEITASADIVYIHASAIEGLLYARAAKQINPDVFVIFDYHDSLNYELFYQLKRRGLDSLFKLAWTMYRPFAKRLGQYVDGLVGISETQARDFQALTGVKIPAVAVPNFREFSGLFEETRHPRPEEPATIVWLGTVMEGRDISRMAKWVSNLKPAPNLLVFGHILNESVVEDITATLGDRVTFLGSFNGEKDILPNLPERTIGVFLGWDDPKNTRINEHASPNKYFTYVNMEIPILLGGVLSELAEHVKVTGAGHAVTCEENFQIAFSDIAENYTEFNNGARRLKTFYKQKDPSETIRVFLEKLVENDNQKFEL